MRSAGQSVQKYFSRYSQSRACLHPPNKIRCAPLAREADEIIEQQSKWKSESIEWFYQIISITVAFLCLQTGDGIHWRQIETIELHNSGSGLGFGIVGGRNTGVIVKTILPGGTADMVRNCIFQMVFLIIMRMPSVNGSLIHTLKSACFTS